jgi:hypothetical protein
LIVQLADLENIGLSSKQVFFVLITYACISDFLQCALLSPVTPFGFLGHFALADPRHP